MTAINDNQTENPLEFVDEGGTKSGTLPAVELRSLEQFDFGCLNNFDVFHSVGRTPLRSS